MKTDMTDQYSAKRALSAITQLQGKLKRLKEKYKEPVAIIGMGCRFPAKVNDIEQYWGLMHNGVNGISEIPASRWNIDEVYDSNPDAPGKMYTRWGGFVDGVDKFDRRFFDIPPREADLMDPKQCVKSVIRHYFFPLLAGQLIVEIKQGNKIIKLDSEGFDTLVRNKGWLNPSFRVEKAN